MRIGLEWWDGVEWKEVDEYMVIGGSVEEDEEGGLVVGDGIVVARDPNNKVWIGFATNYEYADWYELDERQIVRLVGIVTGVTTTNLSKYMRRGEVGK